MTAAPENQIVGTKNLVDAIFKVSELDYRDTVMLATSNKAGNTRLQYEAGRIVGYYPPNDEWMPLKADTVQSGISGTTVIPVSDTAQFGIGDVVELPESVAEGPGRFRTITAIDESAGEITVDGSNVSLSQGDPIAVDPTRSHTQTDSSGTSTTTVSVDDASLFQEGDTIEVGPATESVEFSIPDGTYSGVAEITITIRDENGDLVGTVDADYDGSSDTEDTYGDELTDELNEKLSNYEGSSIGSATNTTSGAGSANEITVSPDDPDYEIAYTYDDSQAGFSFTIAVDDSSHAEVTDIDTGADDLTVDEAVTFSNDEDVVSDPREDYYVLISTVDVEANDMRAVPQNLSTTVLRRGEAKEHYLKGLTAHAREWLSNNGLGYSSLQTT